MPSLPDARATRRLRPNLLLLGLVAVAAQSWALYSPGDPDRVLPLDIPGLNKVAHLALFAVPVWLLLRAGVGRLVVVPLAIVQVIASEVIQGRFVLHRSGDIWDAVADLVGIGLGSLACPKLLTYASVLPAATPVGALGR